MNLYKSSFLRFEENLILRRGFISVVHEIRRDLGKTPEEVKAAFRVIQNSGEVEDLAHGDPVAIYRESGDPGYRNSSRWMKVGKYDAYTDSIISEYLLTYEPGREKFGAQLDFSEKDRETADGKIVSVPENIYRTALEELHNTL